MTDGTCVAGNAVMVKDTNLGLIGKFYIDLHSQEHSDDTQD